MNSYLDRRALLRASLAVAVAYLTPAARAQPSVRVKREDPVIVRREFERGSPPPDMPKLTPPESGVCDTTFELSAGLTYTLDEIGPGSVTLRVDGLDIVTRQRINIFTLAGAPAKLRAHEEGHRAISEHFYKDAASVARLVATPLIGRTFSGEGGDRAAAEKHAVGKVITVLEQAYQARIGPPSEAANVLYDRLTEHGLNFVDEDEAIAQAIGRAPTAYATE